MALKPNTTSAPTSVTDEHLAELQRQRYLKSKGLKHSEQYQLDFLFPEIVGQREDLVHMPNDYGRSSLFTTRNKKEPRLNLLREKLFHYNEYISILYTGIELRAEDDEIVYLQILKYGQSVPFGQPFDFSIKELVQDVGWAKNGRNYERARECISRLKANEILISNKKAYGTSGSTSLIQNYTVINDGEGSANEFRVWLDPKLITLFAGNTFTSHKWQIYRNFSPVARRLADYMESHKQPYPLDIVKFKGMCGSSSNRLTTWRETVKGACKEVQEAIPSKVLYLGKDDRISFPSA